MPDNSDTRGGMVFKEMFRESMASQPGRHRRLTLGEVKTLFGPPETMGTPPEAKIAMDSAMVDNGTYTLIQHGLNMGQFGGLSNFMGYAALQNVSQNGLIRACIETVADDMTRNWISISRDGQAESDGRTSKHKKEMGVGIGVPQAGMQLVPGMPVSAPMPAIQPGTPLPQGMTPPGSPQEAQMMGMGNGVPQPQQPQGMAPQPQGMPPQQPQQPPQAGQMPGTPPQNDMVNGQQPMAAQPQPPMGMPQIPGTPPMPPSGNGGMITPGTKMDDLQKAEADTNRKISAIRAEIKRLEVRKVFHDAIAMALYFGGCLIYLDTGAKGSDLQNPLNLTKRSAEASKRGFFKRLQVIDPITVFVGQYNSINPLAQDFYVPRSWYVLGQEVHATRMIRVVGQEPPLIFKPAYNFLGIPQAQILWDYVLHFQQNRDAVNRLMQKFSTMVFKTNMTDIMNGTANDLSSLDTRMQMLVRNQSNDGVFAIDKESEDVVKVETPISGVTDILKQSLEMLAAMNRTPAVKLLGISPSGFNSTGESDIHNYYDHIRSQQEKILRPGLQVVLDMIQLSLFGEIDPNIVFTFEPLSEDDKNRAASTTMTKVNTLATLIDRNVISAREARMVLVSDKDSGLDSLDPDDVPANKDPITGMTAEQQAMMMNGPMPPAQPAQQGMQALGMPLGGAAGTEQPNGFVMPHVNPTPPVPSAGGSLPGGGGQDSGSNTPRTKDPMSRMMGAANGQPLPDTRPEEGSMGGSGNPRLTRDESCLVTEEISENDPEMAMKAKLMEWLRSHHKDGKWDFSDLSDTKDDKMFSSILTVMQEQFNDDAIRKHNKSAKLVHEQVEGKDSAASVDMAKDAPKPAELVYDKQKSDDISRRMMALCGLYKGDSRAALKNFAGEDWRPALGMSSHYPSTESFLKDNPSARRIVKELSSGDSRILPLYAAHLDELLSTGHDTGETINPWFEKAREWAGEVTAHVPSMANGTIEWIPVKRKVRVDICTRPYTTRGVKYNVLGNDLKMREESSQFRIPDIDAEPEFSRFRFVDED